MPEARDPRPVGPRLDGHRPAGAAHRPRPGADPLVPPLARRTRQNGVDEEPPIAVFARRSTRAGARSRRDARRVAQRGDLAAGAAQRAGAAARGRGHRHDPRPRRRRPDGVDLVRREAPVGASRRPARRRRPLAHLRLGAARGRPRRDGAPARAAHRHLARSRRVRLGQALRRLPRRHLRPRRPRAAQPDAPRRARCTRRARARRPDRDRDRAGGDLVDLRGRAIACGSRSPAPTGRTSGRRRAVRRCRSIARASSSCCRCSTGRSPLPAPVLPPTTGKDTHAPDSDDEQPPTVWRLEDDQIGARVPLRHGIGLRTTRRRSGRGSRSGTRARPASRRTTRRCVGAWPHRVPRHLARGRRAHGGDARGALGRRGVPRRRSRWSPRSSGRSAGETAFYRERRFEQTFARRLA